MTVMQLFPDVDLAAIALKWGVVELSVFGSALRGDLKPGSDVDFLVTFDPDLPITLWDLGGLRRDLEEAVGRPVDLVDKRALKNPYRRRHIIDSSRLVYAA